MRQHQRDALAGLEAGVDGQLVPVGCAHRAHAVAAGQLGQVLALARPHHGALEDDFGLKAQLAVVGHVFGHVGVVAVAARHQQAGAGAHQHARRDVVDLAQFRLAHAHAPGRLGGAHGAGHHPGGPAGQGALVRFEPALECGGDVPGQQDVGRARGHHHGLIDRGIERAKVLLADAGQAGDERHIDVTVECDGVEEGPVANRGQLGTEGIGPGDDVLDRLELGYVLPRLQRHVQVGVAGGQTGLLVACDGAVDVALAPVVGSQRQVPVAEAVVQLLQVIQGCAGGSEHIAPVVAEHVLLEVEGLARGGHELPHAGRAGAGDRLRVERALDEGQQRQLHRHVAALDLLDDVEQVALGARGHALQVVRTAGVPLLAVANQFVVQVGHGKAAPDAVPDVGRCRQEDHRGLRDSGRCKRAEGRIVLPAGSVADHRSLALRAAAAGVGLRIGGAGGRAGGGGAGAQQQAQRQGAPQAQAGRQGRDKVHAKTFFQARSVVKTPSASGGVAGSCARAAARRAGSALRRKGLI